MNKADLEKLREFKKDVEHLSKQYQELANIHKIKTDNDTKSYTAGYFMGKHQAYALVVDEFTKRGII